MATFDLPVLEITVEEFPWAWTRFEIVSAAKEWKDEKQALILPTLLLGKLIDYYVDLDATTKADLKLLKTALMKKAGLAQDALTPGKLFTPCFQCSGKKAADFSITWSYLTSGILLQCFLTGLVPPVSHQILLRRQPTTFKQAVENTKEVEYALNFETKPTEPVTKDISMINKMYPIEDPMLGIQLQQALDQMTKCLEALETRLQPILLSVTITLYESACKVCFDSGLRSSRLLGVSFDTFNVTTPS